MPTYKLKPLDEQGITLEDLGTGFKAGEKDLEHFFEGNGDTTYVCGRCEEVLVKDVQEGQFENTGFECPACGATLLIPEQ